MTYVIKVWPFFENEIIEAPLENLLTNCSMLLF